MIYDVLIIGAGASGLFLGANLRGFSVAILEKNNVAGKKIIISGGGKCNITNRHISAQNYYFSSDNGKNLLLSALNELKFSDVLKFFSELKFNELKNSQFFCASSSRDVLGVLLRKIYENNIKIFYNQDVILAKKIGDIFEILTANNQKFKARNLVIASGGIGYKTLGASQIGHKIANSFNILTTDIKPALVGFSVQKSEFWFKNLSGVSLRAEILLDKNNFAPNFSYAREIKLKDNILFTHKGVSGPAILNALLFWDKGHLNINFLPEFERKNLIQGKKQLSSVLNLPRRFILEFLASKGLNDKAFSEYDSAQKELILELFSYKFSPAGTFGFERAEVSRGGVSADYLDLNFQSKSVKNLFFIGEVLDITGMLGGYNLHFAFASALRVARALF